MCSGYRGYRGSPTTYRCPGSSRRAVFTVWLQPLQERLRVEPHQVDVMVPARQRRIAQGVEEDEPASDLVGDDPGGWRVKLRLGEEGAHADPFHEPDQVGQPLGRRLLAGKEREGTDLLQPVAGGKVTPSGMMGDELPLP